MERNSNRSRVNSVGRNCASLAPPTLSFGFDVAYNLAQINATRARIMLKPLNRKCTNITVT